MPTVSIIIPIYNVEPYIRQCLQSVMDQTLTEGLECILIDDCGQDKSMDIAQQMVDEYNGNIDFRIIHHEKNRGLSAARNIGIREAKGEWLYFLDSDDWIIPECIELMVEQVMKHLNVNMVFAGTNVTSGEYKWLDYTQKRIPDYSNNREWLQTSMLKRLDFGMTAWNKLIRKDFLIHNNLFFDEGYVHEDEIWNFRASSYIKSAAFVFSNTYNYRVRDCSIIKDANLGLRWDRLFVVWRRMAYHIKKRDRKLLVAGLCTYIIEKTKYGYPIGRKWDLFRLFCVMAFKYCSLKSVLYFMQGVIAIVYRRKYNNEKIINRIILH